MAAKDDAVRTVSGLLYGGLGMPAPAGHTTKQINGKTQTVSAHEAWAHSSTDQTDVPTIKLFVNAIAEEMHKRGDPNRAAALLRQAAAF